MVDIEALTADDVEFVQATVAKHAAETGSAVAAALLEDWPASIGRFKRIMPRDYKRVLNAIAKAESLGEDVDEAVMEAARG